MKTQALYPGVFYILSDEVLIQSEQDVLDLLGELQPDALILHDHNFNPEFFDLSTHTLGNVLQKLTNYRVRLAIIGDFSQYQSKVLPEFIRESNRHQQYLFVPSVEEVKTVWHV